MTTPGRHVSAAPGALTSDDASPTPFPARTVRADVLVVDDEADVRASMSEVLRTSGFSVDEAEDGQVALAMLRAFRYGMVILDIRMPRLDGVSLIESLEDLPPVIVHSAYSLSIEERQRLGVKVLMYLHKPVSPPELLSVVRGILEGGRDS
ncbi:MAG TPA: response regulator [Acidimicrobiales bacterium]|nr:response regulator [Acidimicrobiales bacterium]